MVAWLSLVISTIGLLVTIIAQRDKLLTVLSDFRSWRLERQQMKKIQEALARYETQETKTESKRKIASLKVVFPILFFPLSISSGLMTILKIQDSASATMIGAAPLALLVLTSIVWTVIEEIKAKTMKWYFWIFLLFLQVFFPGFMGWIWGGLTIGIANNGIPIFWSGIIVSSGLPLFVWAAQYKI